MEEEKKLKRKEKKELKRKEKEENKASKRSKKEEKKKTKVKRRIKRIKVKKIVLVPFILLVLIILGIIGFFSFKSFEKNTIKNVKKIYSERVITTKNTRLYDSKHHYIGTITKDYELELDKIKKYSIKSAYLKIKDSNYYIYYKDIKKDKNKEATTLDSYYLPLNKSIGTDSSIVLYDDNKEIVTLKKGLKKTTVQKEDENNYYIIFLNRRLRLPKRDNIKENELKSNSEKAEHVSVIYYNRINNDCSGDDTCLRPVSLKAHIKKIKDNGYYFINKEDFIDYVNGYINLKDKAVFITVGEVNEEVKKINEELSINISKIEENDGIKLAITNKTSTPNDSKDSVNSYQAKSYTVIDKYVSMAQGLDVSDNGKETPNNQAIAVLNYHFFYDVTKGEYAWCQETICLEKNKFREHLQWLKDNNYKTLTIGEFADWMDGIIEVPEKSVLLTVDDGARGTGKHNGDILIPLLEEYKMHATLFLIAGWWDISNYQSPYLDVQSHSFNLHYEASCRDGRGMVACSDYATVKADLKQSLDIIKDNTSFCFPFYSYDQESLQAIKELGFRVSFIGGSVKARRSNDHYLIPRYPILSDISLDEFIWMVS